MRLMMRSTICAGIVISALGFAAHAAEPASVKDGILVDSSGRTLYTFDKDGSGKSNCNAACATVWPPLIASSAATTSGKFNLVVRDDGSKQWAYEDKPLYRYSADQKPGDTTGDKFGGVWHAVRAGTSADASQSAKPGTNARTGYGTRGYSYGY
jgi:predicted lipoprotein with Yx(FWY)xxD motif